VKSVTQVDSVTEAQQAQQVGKLAQDAMFLLFVMTVTGLLSAGGCYFADGREGMQAAFIATAVALPGGVFALVFMFRHGTGPGAMVAITVVRVALTMGLAGFIAWKFSSLRTLSFFISVTVVYQAGLFVETRLALKNHFR